MTRLGRLRCIEVPFLSQRADGMRDQFDLITQMKLATVDYQPSGAANGLFRAMPNMEVLTLCWPGHEAEHMLMQCIPADRAPIWNLHAIIIIAVDMTGMIPGGLPNLRELVISAGGRLELSFEDPAATCENLKIFYACGQCQQSLMPIQGNMRTMCHRLGTRGTTIGEVSAYYPVNEQGHSVVTSCAYLRPADGPDLSMGELKRTVYRLAFRCRCGACFKCLREAGCKA